MRIIGVRVAHAYPRSTFLKQITTDGQTLETTFDDIENIVDRIVAGVCPQPTAGVIYLISFTLVVCSVYTPITFVPQKNLLESPLI